MRKKEVVVIGGGLAGLTAAFYLRKKGFSVFVLERQKVFGGLASGFKFPGWDWYAEKTVHHIFENDSDIIEFAKELDWQDKIIFRKPLTGSVYLQEGRCRFFALDTPLSFLKFPYLSFPAKLRTGFFIFLLKFLPFLKVFEKISSLEFIRKFMGEQSFKIMWQPLFRKKFGKYAGKILSSFFWARIKKRTARLGYFKGGFQVFIDHIVSVLKKQGVVVLSEVEVLRVLKGRRLEVEYRQGGRVAKIRADYVIAALQLPIFLKLTEHLFKDPFLSRLKRVQYMNAISLAVESCQPMVKDFYWINNSVEEFGFTGVFQHTNFVDKRFYAGRHFGYIGWYCDFEDEIWRMSDKEIFAYAKDFISKLNPDFSFKDIRYKVFRAVFAQPIYDKKFLQAKIEMRTPVEGLYFAGFELSYPYDRGTNYAVKVGRECAEAIIERESALS